jgi:hypothetical protein
VHYEHERTIDVVLLIVTLLIFGIHDRISRALSYPTRGQASGAGDKGHGLGCRVTHYRDISITSKNVSRRQYWLYNETMHGVD